MLSRFLWMVPFVLLACGSSLKAGEQYAFLVGIGGYDEKQLRGLGEFPRADVVEFRDVLLASGFKPENIVLMVDDLSALPRTGPAGRYLPEAAKIRKELQLLLPALERDDTLIVALSGHGVQFQGESEPYFCPLDTRLDDKTSLISLSWLYDQLKYDEKTETGCRPRQKLLLVDACRNDPASRLRRDSGGPELASVSRPQMAAPPEGVVALFSCAEGQQALQHDPLRHGIFFYQLLEGWKGGADGDKNGDITLDEIIAFTKSQTQTYARVNLGAPQTPRQKGYFDGTWILRSVEKQSPLLTNSIGMKLVRIPAGEFLMGSPDSDTEAEADEKPQHRVRITRDFYLGRYEVTKGQFGEFVRAANYRTEAERDGEGGWGWNEGKGELEGRKPEYTWRNTGFAYGDDHPVVNVSWNDAAAFCEWLSRKEGKSYRLPTEAEWEYAHRGGTTTVYWHGTDAEGLARIGNVADGTAKSKFSGWTTILARDGFVFTSPVGSYQANGFDLYDTTGNVWEWCGDWYDAKYYSQSQVDDPAGLLRGSDRVHRGGSWYDTARSCRSANRNRNDPSNRNVNLGFRVALSP